MAYTDGGNPEELLESYACSYDKSGRITRLQRKNRISDENPIDETRQYTYDSHGRLTQDVVTDNLVVIDPEEEGPQENTQTFTYTYDAAGNRIGENGPDGAVSYTYNGLSQLEGMESAAEEVTYAYDERGNRIRENNVTEGTAKTNTYAVTGELLSVSQETAEGTAVLQTNDYDEAGQRIRRLEGNAEKTWHYDDEGSILFTEDGSGVLAVHVNGASGNLIGAYRTDNSGSRYDTYHKDIQGSTSAVTASDGSLAALYRYSDFGEVEEAADPAIDNDICYTGAVYDRTTGLHYLNARYYDPGTANFLSQDTYRGGLMDEKQWNLYAYCANDPVNYSDPTGHFAVAVAFTVGIAFGPLGWIALGGTAAIMVGFYAYHKYRQNNPRMTTHKQTTYRSKKYTSSKGQTRTKKAQTKAKTSSKTKYKSKGKQSQRMGLKREGAHQEIINGIITNTMRMQQRIFRII